MRSRPQQRLSFAYECCSESSRGPHPLLLRGLLVLALLLMIAAPLLIPQFNRKLADASRPDVQMRHDGELPPPVFLRPPAGDRLMSP